MKKYIGFLLLGLSMLTLALVMSLGQVSLSIKMARQGNFDFSSAPAEIPNIVYFMIFSVISLSIYLFIQKKQK